MRLHALAPLLAFTAACTSSGEPGDDPAPRTASPPIAAPAPPRAPTDATSVRARMLAHFEAVSELQRAIARGQLDDAKAQARWLVDLDEPQLAGWKPYVDEMRAAARDVVAAPDVPTAAALAARLGRACSRCHEAQGAVVTFAWEPVLDEDPALQVQMKRHQWAAARLWEGLVGPSDVMWNEGTSVLAAAHLDAALAAGGTPRGDVTALVAHVRELATRAGTVTDPDARGQLYGELLSTCAGCHALVRPQPVR